MARPNRIRTLKRRSKKANHGRKGACGRNRTNFGKGNYWRKGS